MLAIPTGVSGDWKIERFTVSKEAAMVERMRAIFNGGRGVPAGTYTRLMRGGVTVMSDTPDEIRDHGTPIAHAHDHVLINGLGLGVVLDGVLSNLKTTRATIIELSVDVISLVAPYYLDKYGHERLEIVQADALEYKPPRGSRYGIVWNDIWDYICTDNLPEMEILHRRYSRRAAWVGSWCRDECKRSARRERCYR